jgi:hypothetical protein
MVLGILKPLWAINNTLFEMNHAPELFEHFFMRRSFFDRSTSLQRSAFWNL